MRARSAIAARRGAAFQPAPPGEALADGHAGGDGAQQGAQDRRRGASSGAPADAVHCRGAGKRFGDVWAVHDLDLAVPRGTILGVIGPSGCGKTTTMRLINGVYRPDAGEVTVLGRQPWRTHARHRVELGYLPQQPVLFADLSLWENLNFHASLNGVRLRRRRRLGELLELVDLTEDRRKLVRESSGGMQRRLALAATLVHRPPLLLLDEPTAGIDPILRQRFWDHFHHLRDDGHTLLVTTQHVEEAARCDLVALMVQGRLIALGEPEELRRSAFGGDLIEVELARVPSEESVADLCTLHVVREVGLVQARRIRLVVADAAAAMPLVAQRLQDAGVEVVGVSEVAVDYDDVFVRLVGRAAA